ncbi:SigE family RNA polymerase sigma factor [Nocardioides sp. cx-173]|uniref:SigE family RNA polymerase sigma factor n=1 Tax=Nocardioides sp. cx-173 TaxID=2898796 RepID=UPI001E58FC64|nr:SigE family RNA polymerase sigma factor [Nocardioides sp. cx-173]MCD4526320.1 SigE family RNA polymerase sigma factor [Nocardioides sp. cx-173]UGB43496.1 SigE family RNA polymerase sigma factor [Nocardioides sp. cx-173]
MRRDRREQDFSEFFLARGPALRRTAYLIVRDWHTAEDLTQQAFVKLYAAWPRIRRESAEAYARRTVVNQCLSHLRRHAPEHPTEVLPERVQPTGEGPLDVGRALALLPPRQRAIVALRFLDDLSVADVARTLSIAEGTVKSQTSRALDTLRTHLPDLVLTEEPR